MIRISDLQFRYPRGEFRLEIDELVVESGTAVAFVGPSGSGKTTLLNLIAGIATPSRGRVETAEIVVSELSDAARREFRISNVGLVFQEFELLEYLSVLDNVLLPYRIHPSMRLDGTVRDRARELTERMGIGHLNERRPGELSQGERQRLAVCRAVLPDPPLLLADEPTGNLDPANKGKVMDLLLDYAGEVGATLVTVTHDHALLPSHDRVVDFEAFGRIGAPSGGAEGL